MFAPSVLECLVALGHLVSAWVMVLIFVLAFSCECLLSSVLGLGLVGSWA